MHRNDRKLFSPGERMRVGLYTSGHDRLHLEIWNEGIEAVVDLVFCNKVFFAPAWDAGEVRIEKHGDEFVRVHDGSLDVICREASRFDMSGNRVFFINRESMDEADPDRQ